MFNPDTPFKLNDLIDPYSDQYSYQSDSDLDEAQDTLEPAADSARTSETALADRVLTAHRSLAIRDTAYKTWSALIFHLYTGRIVFAPLRSSRAKLETTSELKGNSEPEEDLESLSPNVRPLPAPCSPKSMYRLADKIGLKVLEERAFEQLLSGISKENVVEEYFTSFTSQYYRVRAALLSLIMQNYRDTNFRPLFRERSMAFADRSYFSDLLMEVADTALLAAQQSFVRE